MQFRSTGTRLATAVTAVLAVTAVGAGTLATAPAAFAAVPAAVPAAATAAEAADLAVFPENAQLGGVGTSGFLSYYFEDTERKLLWTPYDGSAPTRLPVPEGGGWAGGGGSDVVVLGDASWSSEMRSLTLRNMATPYAPGVTLDLTPLNGTYVATLGPTSVLAQLTDPDTGAAELHVVTKDGTSVSTREITGLPADADEFFGSAVHDGTVLVGYATGPENARTGGRAVVDLASGAVTATYASPESFYGFGGLSLSASHATWFGYESGVGDYVASVDRKTGEQKKTVLGAHGSQYHALLGDWLVHGKPSAPVKAVSLTSGETVDLLASGTDAAASADGSVTVRGANGTGGDGLFRITVGADGRPAVVQTAEKGALTPLSIQQVHIPDTVVDLDKTGGTVKLGWTLSRRDAYLDVTLTHTASGKEFRTRVDAPASGNVFSFTWDATIGGVDAPNGRYAVEAEATSLDGLEGPVYQGWFLGITRTANPHDFTDNGSTDVLARDAAGVLWRDDLRDRPVDGQVKTAQRTKIGSGWNTYKQIEAVGNIGGAAHGDLVALDGSGYLWRYLAKGDGTFTPREKIGHGWGIYNKLTGGSDLNGDGKADLLATDTSGVLWLYKGTGTYTAPYAARVRVGGGWQIYNHITAVGNIAGSAAGDLVARDKDGVLWLYQGNGAGNFATRVRIGGGWNAFTQLVGAGDVTGDGRPDLIAYGSGGTYVYRSTGSVTAPFSRMATTLYAGEGTKFTSVS